MKKYSLYFVLKDKVSTKDMYKIYSRTLNCINKTSSQPIQALGATPEKAFRHLKTQSDLHAYGVSWTEGTKKKEKSDGSFYKPKVQSFHYLGIVGEIYKQGLK